MNEGFSIIADKYAIAMIELADKQCILDAVNSDLYLFKDTVNANKELKDFIEHPLITSSDKKEILNNIFKEHVNLYSMNLVRLIADNNRLFLLPFIADYYNKLLCEKRNIDTAQIITAVEIDEDTKNRVKEKLEQVFKKQIVVETSVDQNIIAGMVVKVQDKVIDGSVRTKFENMKKEVIGYGKH